MSFLSISYFNFRNLKNTSINIAYPEVFLVGKNGQGKTNFLEALYISSYGSSFKTVPEAQISAIGSCNYKIKTLYKENEEITILSLERFKYTRFDFCSTINETRFNASKNSFLSTSKNLV